jgi:hypothetical protein
MGQSGSGLFQETIRPFHTELISPRHPVSALVSCLPELQQSAFGMSATSPTVLQFALWQRIAELGKQWEIAGSLKGNLSQITKNCFQRLT